MPTRDAPATCKCDHDKTAHWDREMECLTGGCKCKLYQPTAPAPAVGEAAVPTTPHGPSVYGPYDEFPKCWGCGRECRCFHGTELIVWLGQRPFCSTTCADKYADCPAAPAVAVPGEAMEKQDQLQSGKTMTGQLESRSAQDATLSHIWCATCGRECAPVDLSDAPTLVCEDCDTTDGQIIVSYDRLRYLQRVERAARDVVASKGSGPHYLSVSPTSFHALKDILDAGSVVLAVDKGAEPQAERLPSRSIPLSSDTATTSSARHRDALREALIDLLNTFVRGGNSGDWGDWDPEECYEVIAARAALSRPTAGEQTTGTHPEDTCQHCGGPNVVWFAPNDLWNRVMGGEAGIVCPRCFVLAAEKAGISEVWRLAPDNGDQGLLDRTYQMTAHDIPLVLTGRQLLANMARAEDALEHPERESSLIRSEAPTSRSIPPSPDTATTSKVPNV